MKSEKKIITLFVLFIEPRLKYHKYAFGYKFNINYHYYGTGIGDAERKHNL